MNKLIAPGTQERRARRGSNRLLASKPEDRELRRAVGEERVDLWLSYQKRIFTEVVESWQMEIDQAKSEAACKRVTAEMSKEVGDLLLFHHRLTDHFSDRQLVQMLTWMEESFATYLQPHFSSRQRV